MFLTINRLIDRQFPQALPLKNVYTIIVSYQCNLEDNPLDGYAVSFTCYLCSLSTPGITPVIQRLLTCVNLYLKFISVVHRLGG